jgi:hypothetical protein
MNLLASVPFAVVVSSSCTCWIVLAHMALDNHISDDEYQNTDLFDFLKRGINTTRHVPEKDTCFEVILAKLVARV